MPRLKENNRNSMILNYQSVKICEAELCSYLCNHTVHNNQWNHLIFVEISWITGFTLQEAQFAKAVEHIYHNMSNVFMTPPIFFATPMTLRLRTIFNLPGEPDIADSNMTIYLDIYLASVLGFLQVKLLQLYYTGNEYAKTCVPMGTYRIAVIGCKESLEVNASVQFRSLDIYTDIYCPSFDNSNTVGEWKKVKKSDEQKRSSALACLLHKFLIFVM